MIKTLISCAVLLTAGWYLRDVVHYTPGTRTATVQVPKMPNLPKVSVNP